MSQVLGTTSVSAMSRKSHFTHFINNVLSFTLVSLQQYVVSYQNTIRCRCLPRGPNPSPSACDAEALGQFSLSVYLNWKDANNFKTIFLFSPPPPHNKLLTRSFWFIKSCMTSKHLDNYWITSKTPSYIFNDLRYHRCRPTSTKQTYYNFFSEMVYLYF